MNFLKSLIERLRGRKKLPPKKVYQKYVPQTQTEPPKENFSVVAVDAPKEKIFVLDIHNDEELENYFARLQNFDSVKNFSQDYNLRWAKVRLDNVEKVLEKIRTMNDFDDEEFNFKLACKVRDVAKYMLEIFSNAKDFPSLDDAQRTQLRNSVEEYLSNVGLVQKKFSTDDSYDDWADLSMKNSVLTVSTDNPAFKSKIISVEIQPHVINYRDERGETEQLTFGGLCTIYKFKEE